MEEIGFSRESAPLDVRSATEDAGTQRAWRDLREWIARVEERGLLKRIRAPVDTDEELSAITFLAARAQTAPALMFENLTSGERGMRVLANMLGASAARYAVAMGLDDRLSTRDMIVATRKIMGRRIPPKMIPKQTAPVNECVQTGADVDLMRFPAPKFWPGDGGRYIGTGDITLTRDPATGRINVGCYRQMIQGRDRVSLYCSPGKHGRLDREAWWRRGEPCEIVAAYGVDPVLFMVAAQVFGAGESELEVAGGMMGAPVEMVPGIAV